MYFSVISRCGCVEGNDKACSKIPVMLRTSRLETSSIRQLVWLIFDLISINANAYRRQLVSDYGHAAMTAVTSRLTKKRG